MNKAYDRVGWAFIEAVLTKLGFSNIWVNRVMYLVTTVSYAFQVNGFKTGNLTPNRGLRQGDPIPPSFFILVFDVLSRMIFQAHSRGEFLGIQLANSSPTLTCFLQMMQ